MPLPSSIKFTSYLQYSPRGDSDVSRRSKVITRAIKEDGFLKHGEVFKRACVVAAAKLATAVPLSDILQSCFGNNVILVPVPRSAPLVTGGLWPTQKLCDAIAAEGLAADVLPLLVRTKAVQKSATATAGQRPTPLQHFQSLAVAENRPFIGPDSHLVIVDDVITRGATLIACHAHLESAYPNVPISCFALIRTMSGVEIDSIVDPVDGTITTAPYLHREP